MLYVKKIFIIIGIKNKRTQKTMNIFVDDVTLTDCAYNHLETFLEKTDASGKSNWEHIYGRKIDFVDFRAGIECFIDLTASDAAKSKLIRIILQKMIDSRTKATNIADRKMGSLEISSLLENYLKLKSVWRRYVWNELFGDDQSDTEDAFIVKFFASVKEPEYFARAEIIIAKAHNLSQYL